MEQLRLISDEILQRVYNTFEMLATASFKIGVAGFIATSSGTFMAAGLRTRGGGNCNHGEFSGGILQAGRIGDQVISSNWTPPQSRAGAPAEADGCRTCPRAELASRVEQCDAVTGCLCIRPARNARSGMTGVSTNMMPGASSGEPGLALHCTTFSIFFSNIYRRSPSTSYSRIHVFGRI